jgi:hypothetical protein
LKFDISESLNTRVGVQRKFPSRHYGYQEKVNSRGASDNTLVFPAHENGPWVRASRNAGARGASKGMLTGVTVTLVIFTIALLFRLRARENISW